MSNLAQRLITGSIFVVVLVGCIWFNPFTLALLCLAVTVLGLHEFYKLARKANAEPMHWYGVVLGALIVTLTFLWVGGYIFSSYVLIVPALFLLFFIELFRKKSNPMGNVGWTILGIVYIAIPMAMLVGAFTPFGYLQFPPVSMYDFRLPLMFFVLIWVSDSMAYVCGRLFGKHKLWERISPKKTWEGFIGGLIFTVATAGFVAHWCFADVHTFHSEIKWCIIGFVISVTGMLGDMVESLFKRSIDVKDSGTILPGHGGILDRFDALFLSVPFAITTYWILNTILH